MSACVSDCFISSNRDVNPRMFEGAHCCGCSTKPMTLCAMLGMMSCLLLLTCKLTPSTCLRNMSCSACFVNASAILDVPVTFLTSISPELTLSCIQSWLTSMCLTLPSPRRELIPFAAEESVCMTNLVGVLGTTPRSARTLQTPSPAEAPLTMP